MFWRLNNSICWFFLSLTTTFFFFFFFSKINKRENKQRRRKWHYAAHRVEHSISDKVSRRNWKRGSWDRVPTRQGRHTHTVPPLAVLWLWVFRHWNLCMLHLHVFSSPLIIQMRHVDFISFSAKHISYISLTVTELGSIWAGKMAKKKKKELRFYSTKFIGHHAVLVIAKMIFIERLRTQICCSSSLKLL